MFTMMRHCHKSFQKQCSGNCTCFCNIMLQKNSRSWTTSKITVAFIVTQTWQEHVMICLHCFCQYWQLSEVSCLSLTGHRSWNRRHITQVELSYKICIINNILKTKAYWNFIHIIIASTTTIQTLRSLHVN